MPKPPKKSENLNLRIDEKLEFAVWFATKAIDKTKQAFAEGAIRAAADDATDAEGRNWRKFWDTSPGVRELNMIRWGAFDTDVDEDRRLEFVKAHDAFFFTDKERRTIFRAAVDVLWGDIDALQQEWFDTRRADYWGVWRKMGERLTAAGLTPPDRPHSEAEPIL